MPINSGISSDRGILNIDRETVNAKLGMDACIAIMRQAQIDQYSQTAHCPARNFVQLANDSQLLIMPAASTEIVGTKILTLFPTNTSSDTPVIQGVIVLFDSNTGSPLATIDAASVTAIRTAAASAAATDALSQQNAKSLASRTGQRFLFQQFKRVLSTCIRECLGNQNHVRSYRSFYR
ncbi:hypothetical protein OAX71_07825 [Pseudomonadales bacterium]|nr:hypothetical protein [Pseudomonadales bacterium]